MDALFFDAQTKQLELKKTEIPEVTDPNSVLIKVAYAGICGTDLHIIQGEFPCKQDGPIILGHELCGTVTKVGTAVTVVKPDDKVAVDPNSGCHKCQFCHRGNPHFCPTGALANTIGIYRNGGFAEYVIVPDSQVHKLLDGIKLEYGALCEPLSCLSHGWDKISPVTIGQKILILGAGIIGNLWISVLHLQGHKHVTVSEPQCPRLSGVQKLNTGYDLIKPSELEKRFKNDPNYLFDLIIDCSGCAPAIEGSFKYLSPGGTLCLFGVASPEAKICISPFDIFHKEITIVGIKINPFSFTKAMSFVEAMGDRYLDYPNLGIQLFKLSEYKEAIEMLKSGAIAKATFKF